ncbi:peptidylprolyl isomerase [Oceanobacillus bengalensis]|uniref:peptidylprolyl isomerase n=1 Tax=Oceanobacillus bengalensis TaxID=1435466 RepID=A0A494YUD5_9BACI|nr:peptidylprolyl isomerase [Oceanobacillus bengalensis]RKQ13709.1 protein secretion protein [Oceanobacillus bengalensis]
MSRKLLLAIIVVLLVTNIASILIMSNEGSVDVDDIEGKKVNVKDAVATINDEEITYEEWINTLKGSYGKSQLQAMIDRFVVKQLAEERNIQIDEKVIEREIALLTTMQGVVSEESREKMEARWRDEIIYRYQLEQLLTMNTDISEEELRHFYTINGDQYNFNSAMQISHILVDTFDAAEKVMQELNDGATFSLLAKEYSNDEETKDDGGYLGFIHTNSQFFPNGYEDVAAEIDEYTYSEPFQSDNGVAIIYLHRKLPSINFTYEEMKPYVKSELALQEEKQSLHARSLWEELDINWIYDE